MSDLAQFAVAIAVILLPAFDLTLDALTSPLGMALRIAMLVALALLLGGLRSDRLDRDGDGGPPGRSSAFPR